MFSLPPPSVFNPGTFAVPNPAIPSFEIGVFSLPLPQSVFDLGAFALPDPPISSIENSDLSLPPTPSAFGHGAFTITNHPVGTFDVSAFSLCLAPSSFNPGTFEPPTPLLPNVHPLPSTLVHFHCLHCHLLLIPVPFLFQ
jgi:hypothetical protein